MCAVSRHRVSGVADAWYLGSQGRCVQKAENMFAAIAEFTGR
jgi:hypothetical protein